MPATDLLSADAELRRFRAGLAEDIEGRAKHVDKSSTSHSGAKLKLPHVQMERDKWVKRAKVPTPQPHTYGAR